MTTGIPPPPHATTIAPAPRRARMERAPRSRAGAATGRRAGSRGPRPRRAASRAPARAPGPAPRVERPDRLRRPLERRVVGRDVDVREQACDRPLDRSGELRLDHGADLGLSLRNREVERQGRHLVGGALLTQQLVADLRPVSMCDHDLALADERRDRGAGLTQLSELLRRRPAPERVAAERNDDGHTSAACSPIRP